MTSELNDAERKGVKVIEDSYVVFGNHPQFLIPIFSFWLIYAPSILYLVYFFNWDLYSVQQSLAIIFGVIFFWAFFLSHSCSVLLEMIEQHESNKPKSIFKAVGHTLQKNTLKMIPIVLLWSIVWFLLAIVSMILSKAEKNKEFSAENAAKTLANYQEFSWRAVTIEALQKGVRMIVFLMLPAIAWENKGPFDALKKGFVVFRTNLAGFATAFTMSYLAAALIFALPAIIFYLTGKMEIELPTWLWVTLIIYIGFGTSYIIYLEQLFGAELYMWHMRWEESVVGAKASNKPIPNISEITKPTVLDEIYEFAKRKN